MALSDGLLSVEEVALLGHWGDVLGSGEEQLLHLPLTRRVPRPAPMPRRCCDTASMICSLMSRRSPDS
ncbi:hypothetical protein [Synechococcus sp. CBW1107]|uniref:hypothetical protein n=1 Tax=Synechococcus sp. CBW1107 TaxID=2789857 RepID=UPI002AD4FC29|nr:hypothetical protein [Synechococcus sp. CBW1107]